MTVPKVVITITATDGLGTVEARREIPAQQPLDVLRERIAMVAADVAGHAADLIDAHVASLKART